MGAGIGMKREKRENSLVKNNIMRNINTASGYVETFVPLVMCAIAKKSALFRSKGKLVSIIWT
jgi:hypothetical protein